MIEYLSDLHSQLIDPERFAVVLLALLLCAVVGMVTGPMHGNANPFLWGAVNGLFGRLGKRLDRTQRPPADLMMRGFALTVFVLVLVYFIGQAAAETARLYPYWRITEVVLLALAMTAGTVWFALLRVYGALEKGGKIAPGAYAGIVRTTRADLSRADDFAITRVTMGMAARTFDKGLVAPALWFMILGLPGAYIYAALAALAWRFGKDGFTRGFGRLPLALERLMGFVPTMLAGFLMAAAGLLTPTGGMTRSLTALLRPGGAPYEEGGAPVTAMAHSLNITLGGPVNDLDGSAQPHAWVGPASATAKLESGHLRRALYISMMAHLLFIFMVLGAMLWAGKIFPA